MLKDVVVKYSDSLGDMDKIALKLLHRKIHEAMKMQKKGETYTKPLLELRDMLSDVLKEKGVVFPDKKTD